MLYLWPYMNTADSSSPGPLSSLVTKPTDGNSSPDAAKVSIILDSRVVPAIFPEGVPSTFRRGQAGSVRASVASMTDRLTAQVSCLALCVTATSLHLSSSPHLTCTRPFCPAGSPSPPGSANIGQQGRGGCLAPSGGSQEEKGGPASRGAGVACMCMHTHTHTHRERERDFLTPLL